MKSAQRKEEYLNEEKKYKLLGVKEDKYLLLLSVFRLISFIGGLILIWFGFTISILAGTVIIILVSGMFIYLLKLYSDHSDRRDFFNNLVVVNRNEANAVTGDLSSFENGSNYSDPGHDFSNDVDLFGDASLFQYLNRTVTDYGRDILAGWLCDPFVLSPALIERQEAIRELSAKAKWRHEFMATGMKTPLEKNRINNLLEWMSETTVINSSAIKKILIYFLPAIAIVALFLLIAGLNYSVFIFIILVNLLFTTIGLKRTNKVHNVLSGKYLYLSSIHRILKAFENESFTSGILKNIKSNITGRKVSASVAVNKLGRLIQMFDNRLNMIVGILLNGLILWDYHAINRLEKWKTEYKRQFPEWLKMLGEIDAFISLGNYAYNNNDFIYPDISDKNNFFYAKQIGHQLIDEQTRVCNDFSLDKQGLICVISGANMAGKSTFLRTIAVNYILGMAGAPVCAEEMKFVPLRLFTSMRTTDSLSSNESYFYAELKRLKMLKLRMEKGEPLLFILDEILKGTNSADKSLGSKLFVKKMVKLGGTGLIATHDTSLGEMENDYPDVIFNRSFELEIEDDILKFDYKLQNGITRKMNAVLLMKQMGILE